MHQRSKKLNDYGSSHGDKMTGIKEEVNENVPAIFLLLIRNEIALVIANYETLEIHVFVVHSTVVNINSRRCYLL